jgi:hypothetical protein
MTPRPKTADEWLEAVHREFQRESDRAAAIVSCAILDEGLKALLRKRLVAPEKPNHSLIDGPNPYLDSFSARIDASFQLGLISQYLARDLHLIRKIRNEFAHQPQECTFETSRVGDWVRTLEAGSDYNRRFPERRKAIGPPGARWDFLGIAAWILYSIYSTLDDVKTITEQVPEFGYIDWDQLPEDIRKHLFDSDAT